MLRAFSPCSLEVRRKSQRNPVGTLTRASVLRCAMLALVLLLRTTGCGLKADVEDSRKAVVAIQDELGIDANVQFRTFTSSASGKQMVVTVSVREPQTADVRQFKEKIVEIVGRTF